MNILIVSHYPIYPFENGASIAQFGIIEYLSKHCDISISLLLPQSKIPTDEELTELKKLLPNVKIYSVENKSISNKKISRSKIDSKLFHLILILKRKIKSFFKALYKNITGNRNDLDSKIAIFSPEEEFARQFSSLRYYVYSQEYVEKIEEIILQDEIDIVQLEFIETLSLVAAIPSNIKKIFIQHDSEISRIKSHINAKKINSCYADYILNFYDCIESSLLKKVDSIITFSNYDNLIMKHALGDKSNQIGCFVSPYAIPDREFKEVDLKDFSKPNKLIFVGPESHFPNQDAVEWFLTETAEEIFYKFGLELHVVGKWSQNTINKYKKHPSKVKFLGFVEDLYEVTKDSISIVPVRIGGGLRTKIMLFMAQLTPVICTQFALEGIKAKHLESVMIAENKESFCWAVEYLLADLERTFLICKNAQKLIREQYSQYVVSEQRYSIYQNMLSSVIDD